MSKRFLSAVVMAVSLTGLPAPAAADVIYSNLVPDGGWSSSSWTTRETESPEIATFFIWWGTPFRPTASGTLTALELPFDYHPDGTGSVLVDLRTSSAGLPDAILESFSFDASNFTLPALHSFSSVLRPALDANTQYFVTVGTSGSANNHANLYGSMLPEDLIAQAGARTGPWNHVFGTPLGLRVQAEPLAATPEPASLLLLGTGLVGLLARRRSRRGAADSPTS
jgi:PEP-CTERM motif-containing protein